MNKRMLCALLALLLAVTAGCAAGTDGEDWTEGDAVFELGEAGVTFDMTGVAEELSGVIQPAYGYELSDGSGIYLSGLTYCAMTREKYDELVAKNGAYTDEERQFIGTHLAEFILVFTIDGNRTMEELNSALEEMGVPFRADMEAGSAGEYRFYALADPDRALENNGFILDDEFRADYERLLDMCGELSWIKVYEPKSVHAAAEGDQIVFETTDLDGNTVKSEDIFSANDLTMINIWGTYCGPCIAEMPELALLSDRLSSKGCAVIGVVVDIRSPSDSDTIAAAKEILSDTGVEYLNILMWDSFPDDLPSQFVPTTYFVDRNGCIVGEAVIGAQGADDYEAVIDELMKKM